MSRRVRTRAITWGDRWGNTAHGLAIERLMPYATMRGRTVSWAWRSVGAVEL